MDRDDTHYLKSELYEEVRSNSEIFEFLQAGSLDGIWYWDLENPEVEWMSPEFWKTFGVDPSSKPHLTSTWQDIIDPDDLKVALDNFEKHCEDPSHPYDQIVRYRHSNGSTVWVRCRGMAVRDASGKPVRMLGAHTNITGFKETYLDEIVGSLTHDFRAPLRRVKQFIKLLENKISDQLDDDSQQWMHFINQNTQLMQEMIEDLSELTKVVTTEDELEVIDVEKLIQRVKDVLDNEIRATDATVSLSPSVPRVMGIPSLIERLFRNLIDNALKHRGNEAPVIQISATEIDGNRVQFTITDNGVGIDEAHLPKIFELFTRFHQPNDRSDGSGTGLSICRRIAQRHNSGINVSSVLGESTTFSFHLQLANTTEEVG